MSSGSQVQHLVVVSVVGVGLVGSELVDQLSKLPRPGLRDQFQLLSLSSSRSTVYYDIGSDWWSNWRQDLTKPRAESDVRALVTRLTQISTVEEVAGLREGVSFSVIPVLVDNTSSEAVARLYPFLLNNGINIVTPNKKAFSSELTLYEEIVAASLKTGARFYNESTVGAGLPIISTIKDLVATGDKVWNEMQTFLICPPHAYLSSFAVAYTFFKVTKIEGVFSGTLSYIFNEFSDGKSGSGPSFSSIVSVARENGYTVRLYSCLPTPRRMHPGRVGV
jgi:homoserine dehydrogenase